MKDKQFVVVGGSHGIGLELNGRRWLRNIRYSEWGMSKISPAALSFYCLPNPQGSLDKSLASMAVCPRFEFSWTETGVFSRLVERCVDLVDSVEVAKPSKPEARASEYLHLAPVVQLGLQTRAFRISTDAANHLRKNKKV